MNVHLLESLNNKYAISAWTGHLGQSVSIYNVNTKGRNFTTDRVIKICY